MSPWYVNGDDRMDPVLEVYESFQGDLYFVTRQDEHRNFGYVRLYAMPQFAEWGSFGTLEALKREYGEHQIWPVPEDSWPNIVSYEDDLLVQDADTDTED